MLGYADGVGIMVNKKVVFTIPLSVSVIVLILVAHSEVSMG